MTEHTPGPLLVMPNVRTEVEGMDYMIRSGDAPDGDTTLALVSEEADAVLYAASPYLLAALEEISNRYGWDRLGVSAHPAVKRVLAAIAMARTPVRL